MKLIMTSCLLAFGLTLTQASAQDGELPDHKLSEWTLGEHLFGDEVKMNKLKGRVVVIEEWGVQWGPCITAMPHLVKMDKKMKSKGLTIIAAESQNTPGPKIKKLLDTHKAEFTVTRQVRGPLSSRGIPNAYVFGVDGQLIYKGHPMSDDFEKTIKTALKEFKVADPEPKGDVFRERTWKNSDGKLSEEDQALIQEKISGDEEADE